MGGRWRRPAQRICIALASACALVAFIAPSAGAAEDDDVPPPEVWGANASSRAVSINLDRAGLLPVPDVFNFIALDGSAEYGSSSQQARASLLFPGNGVLLGPSLACGTFGGQFPAEFKPILDTCLKYQYPLTVFADAFNPDSSTNGSLSLGTPKNDIQADATLARAHAAADKTTTDAVLQDLRVLGIPPFGPLALPGGDSLKLDTSIVDIDSATSRTDQRIVKGDLVTIATVKMSGIKLIGGLIRIGSLTSESQVTDDAEGKRTADATFHATGVTVAGVPAQITNKGLVIGSPDNKVAVPDALEKAVNGVLKTLNVTVASLPTEEARDKDGAGRASVGGLIVSMARDVQGLPPISLPIPGIPVNNLDPNGTYTLTVQLGLTGVLGSAANYGSDQISDDLGDTLDDLGVAGFDSDGDFGFGDDGGFNDEAGLGAPNQTGVGGANTDRTPNATLVRTVANNFGGRLGLLYLALMFAVLALCIAPRLAVPARLPGPKD